MTYETDTRVVWKRGAVLVVAIELLTAVIGLFNKVGQLVKLSNDDKDIMAMTTTTTTIRSTTLDDDDDEFIRRLKAIPDLRDSWAERKRERDAQVEHSMLVCFMIAYIFMILFDMLLFVGIWTSKTRFLRIWHKFSLVMIGLFVLASLAEALTMPDKSDAPPQLIIRIFETWILDEYLKSIEAGFVYQRDSLSV